MEKTRILIADGHEMVRWGVAALLGTYEDLGVCGQTSTGEEAVDACVRLSPSLVLIDPSLPGIGVEPIRHITGQFAGIEVLVLTLSESEELIRDVLSAGARGYVLKTDGASDLIAAIHVIQRRQLFLTPKIAEVVVRAYLRQQIARPPAHVEPLTRRELEVIRLLAGGKSNKDVAQELQISIRTAETHRANLMGKLNVHSLPALVEYARDHGLTDGGSLAGGAG